MLVDKSGNKLAPLIDILSLEGQLSKLKQRLRT